MPKRIRRAAEAAAGEVADGVEHFNELSDTASDILQRVQQAEGPDRLVVTASLNLPEQDKGHPLRTLCRLLRSGDIRDLVVFELKPAKAVRGYTEAPSIE